MSKERQVTHRRRYVALMILNTLIPAIAAAVLVPLNTEIFQQDEDPKALVSYLSTVTSVLTAVVEIISGWFLILAVFRIRKFYRDMDQIDSINLSTLYLNGAAFGLFLVSVVLYSVGTTFYFFKPNNEPAIIFLLATYVAWIVMGTVSEALMFVILWQLSTEDPDNAEIKE